MTIVLVVENGAVVTLALGRSKIRRRILDLLTSEPDVRLHLREIQRRARTSPGTASRELGRLVSAGLVEREAEGSQVYFRLASSPHAMAFLALLAAPTAPVAPTAPMTPTGPVAPAGPNATGPVDSGREEATAGSPSTRSPRTISAAPQIRNSHRPDALGLKVAGRLAEVLRPLYAGRLGGIFLYGARARGEPRPDADVEVAVVLESIPSYGDELERTSSTCAGLSLEYGLIVSRVFISEDAWKTRTDGHLPAIRTESVAV
jgi:predicted transcriptional regulator with HTH domain